MLHKDLTGLDLHIPKLHAPTHLVGGTDPLGLAESEIAGLVTDLAAKVTGVTGTAPIASSGGAAPAISLNDGGVTYAKIQNISATDKVLGRVTAGAGSPEEIACTAAGRALLDDANAAAQLATLGITSTAAELNLLHSNLGVWTPNTPTLTATIGTFTTAVASGRWTQVGKTVSMSYDISITTNGSASGYVTITLPVTPSQQPVSVGREINLTGKLVIGTIQGGKLILGYPDNTYPGADAARIVGSIIYEVA